MLTKSTHLVLQKNSSVHKQPQNVVYLLMQAQIDLGCLVLGVLGRAAQAQYVLFVSDSGSWQSNQYPFASNQMEINKNLQNQTECAKIEGRPVKR